jgi:hypothetical protein
VSRFLTAADARGECIGLARPGSLYGMCEVVVGRSRREGTVIFFDGPDRERKSLEGEVESHERRIDEAVIRLYGVKGLPGG